MNLPVNDNWICDRTVLDVCAYSLYNRVWDAKEVHSILSQYSKKIYYPDMVFYLPIEFDMVQDGERPSKGREDIDQIMLKLLQVYYPKYKTLRGTVEEREMEALHAINTFNSIADASLTLPVDQC